VRRILPAGLCLLAVCVPARAQSAADKEATVAYLQKLQAKEGGFLLTASADRPSLRATNGALRALKYFGGTVPDREACARFVKSCFDRETGGFADMPGGKPDVNSTAVGIMAVIELKLPTAPPLTDAVLRYLGEHTRTFEEIRIAAAAVEALGKRPPQADRWLAEILKGRHDNGTYGQGAGLARATGGATVAVLRLGGKVDDPKAVLDALDRGQRPDGGFGEEGGAGSDLATTYRVVRCYHMLKARPKAADRCRDFIARCRNQDGGYGVSPGQPSSVSGTYYAGIVLHWLEEK
jgi:prenyltransferase beta subunit